jgi:hypothetical protein
VLDQGDNLRSDRKLRHPNRGSRIGNGLLWKMIHLVFIAQGYWILMILLEIHLPMIMILPSRRTRGCNVSSYGPVIWVRANVQGEKFKLPTRRIGIEILLD